MKSTTRPTKTRRRRREKLLGRSALAEKESGAVLAAKVSKQTVNCMRALRNSNKRDHAQVVGGKQYTGTRLV